jgi:hypothetical protein
LFKFLKVIINKLSNNISTQEEVYNKIQQGGFKKTNSINYKGNPKDKIIEFEFANSTYRLSEKDTQNLMRGALYSLLERLSQRGMSFADIENSDINYLDFFTKDTYGTPIFNELIKDIANALKKEGKDPKKSSIINFLAYSMKNNIRIFYKSLARYLGGFKIKINSPEDVDIEE